VRGWHCTALHCIAQVSRWMRVAKPRVTTDRPSPKRASSTLEMPNLARPTRCGQGSVSWPAMLTSGWRLRFDESGVGYHFTHRIYRRKKKPSITPHGRAAARWAQLDSKQDMQSKIRRRDMSESLACPRSVERSTTVCRVLQFLVQELFCWENSCLRPRRNPFSGVVTLCKRLPGRSAAKAPSDLVLDQWLVRDNLSLSLVSWEPALTLVRVA
jgi:hypothetical protein